MDAQICPTCAQAFEHHQFEGRPYRWCRRCSILSAGADELERLAEALSAACAGGRKLDELLPPAEGQCFPARVTGCQSCGGTLYHGDRYAWSVCSNCTMRFVPSMELSELVNDPALAHRTPLGMPIKLTKASARHERSASFVLGVGALVLAGLCAVLVFQHWDEISLAKMLVSRRYMPAANYYLIGLFCFGGSGIGLVLRGASARAGGHVE
ncbi:MAG: hypothetical protein ACOX6T_10180 [Myxococcales bacterium]